MGIIILKRNMKIRQPKRYWKCRKYICHEPVAHKDTLRLIEVRKFEVHLQSGKTIFSVLLLIPVFHIPTLTDETNHLQSYQEIWVEHNISCY